MASFEDILDSCLAQIRAGRSLEECLALYPEQAQELRELLNIALMTQEAFSALGLRPELKAQVQYRLLSQPQKAPQPWFLRRWSLAVMPALALLLLGGGTVLAANNSLPGERLYGVKLATEQLQLRFSRGQVDRAELRLKLAEKRIDEMAKLAEKHKPQAVAQAGQRMIKHLQEVGGSLKAMKRADAEKLKSQLRQRAAQHRQQLRGLKQALPSPLSAPQTLGAREAGETEDWEGEYEKLLEGLLEEDE